MKSPDDQAGRASALRRHWRNPDRIAKVKADIRAAVLRDMLLKEIASEVGITEGKVCRWAHVLGFRTMYVTDAERQQIVANRRQAERTAA